MLSLLIALVLGVSWGLTSYLLRERTGLSAVTISAGLTLVAGLVLPFIFTEGTLFALCCTAVSYASMSNQKRIANWQGTIVVSLFCTGFVYFGQNVLVGVGGRLGSMAALAVLVWLVIQNKKEMRKTHA